MLTGAKANVSVGGTLRAQNKDGSGGEILLGGGRRGADANIPDAARVSVTRGAVVDVGAAAVSADGGEVVVWSDRATHMHGSILARAGAEGGNGGQVEVSSRGLLDFNPVRAVDTTAPAGQTGSLLLDPASLTIEDDDGAGNVDLVAKSGGLEGDAAASGGSILTTETLEDALASSDVTLQTGEADSSSSGDGAIVLQDPISWSTDSSLSLTAQGDVRINANITAPSAIVDFAIGDGGAGFAPGALSVAPGTTVKAARVYLDTYAPSGCLQCGGEGLAPPAEEGQGSGGIDWQGVLDTDDLEIRLDQDPDIAGGIRIADSNNRIGKLGGINDSASLHGDVHIVNGSLSGMTVTGSFPAVAGTFTLVSAGNLVFAPTQAGERVSTVGAGHDIVLAATTGSFINAGKGINVTPASNARYLIYSDNPDPGHTQLNPGSPGYGYTPIEPDHFLEGKSWQNDPPGDITAAGNLVLYSMPTGILTFAADDQTITYGNAAPDLTWSYSGLLTGDTLDKAVTGQPLLSTGSETDAGIYTINIGQGTLRSEEGYSFSFVPGTLTIEPASLTVIANSVSRIYGEDNPVFGYTVSGLKNGDEASLFSTTLTSPADAASNVGSYPIGFGSHTLDSKNYTLTLEPGTLTVTQRPLTLTPISYSRFYGYANPKLGYTVDGLAKFDSVDDVLNGATVVTKAESTSDVGDYPLSFSIVAKKPGSFGGKAGNYSFTQGTGTLHITPAPLTLFAGSFTSTYGDVLPSLAAQGLDGLRLASDAGQLGTALDGDYNRLTDAGAYTLHYSLMGAKAKDYYIAKQVGGSLTIDPRPLYVTLTNSEGVYGNEREPPYVTGIANVAPDSGFLQSSVTVDDPTDMRTGVGDYQAGVSLPPNYVLGSLTGGRITISPRAIALKPKTLVEHYGDTVEFGMVVAGRDGLASLDTLDELVGDITLTDENGGLFYAGPMDGKPLRLNVGSYLLNVALNPDDPDLDNYSIVLGTGLLGVLPRPVTVSVVGQPYWSDQPFPDFQLTASNLAPFDKNANEALESRQGLTFDMFTENPGATVPNLAPVTVDQYTAKIPTAFLDDDFRARFPSGAAVPGKAAAAGVSRDAAGSSALVPPPDATQIDCGSNCSGTTGTVVFNNQTFTVTHVQVQGNTGGGSSGDTQTWLNSGILWHAEAPPAGPYHDMWVGVSGLSNPNYVITRVNPAKIKYYNVESAEYKDYVQDWDKGQDLQNPFLFGANYSFDNQTTSEIVGEMLAAYGKPNDDGRPYFASEGEAWEWLFNATDTQKARFAEPIVYNYLLNTLPSKDPDSLTAGEKEMVSRLESLMESERDYLIKQAEQGAEKWQREAAAKKEGSASLLTLVNLDAPPYSSLITEAIGSRAADSVANDGLIVAGSAAGATALAGGGTAAGITAGGGAQEVIHIHQVEGDKPAAPRDYGPDPEPAEPEAPNAVREFTRTDGERLMRGQQTDAFDSTVDSAVDTTTVETTTAESTAGSTLESTAGNTAADVLGSVAETTGESSAEVMLDLGEVLMETGADGLAVAAEGGLDVGLGVLTSTAAASVGPAIAAALVVAAGVNATMKVVKQDKQERAFNELKSQANKPVTWSDLNAHPGADDFAGQINLAAMNLAISDLLKTGGLLSEAAALGQ